MQETFFYRDRTPDLWGTQHICAHHHKTHTPLSLNTGLIPRLVSFFSHVTIIHEREMPMLQVAFLAIVYTIAIVDNRWARHASVPIDNGVRM